MSAGPGPDRSDGVAPILPERTGPLTAGAVITCTVEVDAGRGWPATATIAEIEADARRFAERVLCEALAGSERRSCRLVSVDRVRSIIVEAKKP